MKGIKIIPTYNCRFMCSTCCYSCAPHKKGFMNVEHFARMTTEAYLQGFNDYLLITGGDMLNSAGMLADYLKYIQVMNIKKQVTSSGYFGGVDPFYDILADLKELGLAEVMLEYDCKKINRIEEKNFQRAIEMCRVCNLGVSIIAQFETVDLSIKDDIETMEKLKILLKKNKGIKIHFTSKKKLEYGIKIHSVEERVISYSPCQQNH